MPSGEEAKLDESSRSAEVHESGEPVVTLESPSSLGGITSETGVAHADGDGGALSRSALDGVGEADELAALLEASEAPYTRVDATLASETAGDTRRLLEGESGGKGGGGENGGEGGGVEGGKREGGGGAHRASGDGCSGETAGDTRKPLEGDSGGKGGSGETGGEGGAGEGGECEGGGGGAHRASGEGGSGKNGGEGCGGEGNEGGGGGGEGWEAEVAATPFDSDMRGCGTKGTAATLRPDSTFGGTDSRSA